MSRLIHASSFLSAANPVKKTILTKAQRVALERKRAAKAPKSWYSNEKLPLTEAVSVLRVSFAALLNYAFSPETYRQ